jgi:hypothetical protein
VLINNNKELYKDKDIQSLVIVMFNNHNHK